KLAWSENWALLLGTDAYDWQRDFDGSVAHSGGDTTLALKYRLPVNESLALGAQFGAGLPTARPPIGSGKTDWGFTAIASMDSGGAHQDLNLGAGWPGAVTDGQGRWQGAWAIAASVPLPKGFGVTGELSGLTQRGIAAQTQGLAAVSYSVSRQLVLDAAVAVGLSSAAPDWQLMAGMTVQLGRWF
ncbi:MAG TPA: transporter, partial [Burkholderiales bacterium]